MQTVVPCTGHLIRSRKVVCRLVVVVDQSYRSKLDGIRKSAHYCRGGAHVFFVVS